MNIDEIEKEISVFKKSEWDKCVQEYKNNIENTAFSEAEKQAANKKIVQTIIKRGFAPYHIKETEEAIEREIHRVIGTPVKICGHKTVSQTTACPEFSRAM